MRRATAALLGTVAGTALLVGAKYASPQLADLSGASVGDSDAALDPSGEASSAEAPADPSAEPSPEPPPAPAPEPTATSKPKPTTTTTASCSTVSGGAATIAAPGVGTTTVTIKVCGGALTAASAVLSRSNWKANDKAVPALNTLAVKYYRTNISKITYSGATLTADAYQDSLKSAMGKAGI